MKTHWWSSHFQWQVWLMLTWSTEFDSWMSRKTRWSLVGTDTKYPPFCLIPVWCLCHLIFGAFSTSARQATLGCATGFIFVLRLSAKALNRKFVGKIYTLNTAAFFLRHWGDISFQCSDAVGWATGKASGRFWPVKEDGCWFVGGDSLIGALHASYLQLLPPLPSTLAPRKSRMVTFWYWLTHVHLENIHVKTERKTEVTACLVACAFSCSLQATYWCK